MNLVSLEMWPLTPQRRYAFFSGLPYFIDLTCLHACFLKIYKVNWEGCRWGELSTAPVRSWDQLRFDTKQSLQPHRPVSRTLLICKCDRENGWFCFMPLGWFILWPGLTHINWSPEFLVNFYIKNSGELNCGGWNSNNFIFDIFWLFHEIGNLENVV